MVLTGLPILLIQSLKNTTKDYSHILVTPRGIDVFRFIISGLSFRKFMIFSNLIGFPFFPKGLYIVLATNRSSGVSTVNRKSGRLSFLGGRNLLILKLF